MQRRFVYKGDRFTHIFRSIFTSIYLSGSSSNSASVTRMCSCTVQHIGMSTQTDAQTVYIQRGHIHTHIQILIHINLSAWVFLKLDLSHTDVFLHNSTRWGEYTYINLSINLSAWVVLQFRLSHTDVLLNSSTQWE